MIVTPLFQKSCRPIKCPAWKTLVRGKCEFYSDRWVGSRFAVTLRVEPATNKSTFSRAFFDEVLKIDWSDKFAKWLIRKTMKRWEIVPFYRLSENNVSVEYLIIQATRHFISVNPKFIEQTIQKTLKDFWYIFYEDKKIPLKVMLTKGKSYVLRRIDNKAGDSPSVLGANPKTVYMLIRDGYIFNSNDSKDKYLHIVPGGEWKPIVEEILITNLFFCNQIDLLPDEYVINAAHTIFFKVKNTTLFDYRRVYTLKKPLAGMPEVVRICLSEFGQTINIGNSNHMFSNDIQMLSLAMYVWNLHASFI
jgi:hypothetical protein